MKPKAPARQGLKPPPSGGGAVTKRVEILTTFRGDPDDAGHATRLFTANSPADVPDVFADLIVRKGLARVVGNQQPSAAGAAEEKEDK
jgi:hypothetical protein